MPTPLRHWLCAVPVLLATFATAVADDVALRGGGRIEGVLLDHLCNDKQLVLRVRTTNLVTEAGSVAKHTRVGTATQRHDQLRSLYGDSYDDHWQLALWCRANELSQTEAEHLARCVQLKPDAAEPRSRLDTLKAAGQVAEPERPAATEPPRPANGPAPPEPPEQGDGDPAAGDGRDRPRPGSPEYREAVRRRQEMDKRVTRLFSQLQGKSAELAESARQELLALRDAAAVPALAKGMSALRDGDRLLMVQVIGQIAGPAADEALTVIALTDPSAEIRAAATDLLKSRPLDVPSYVRPLVGALTSENPDFLYNAADLCVAMDEKGAVPLLVEGLCTPVRSGVLVSGEFAPWRPWGTLRPDLCMTPTGRLYSVRFSSAGPYRHIWYPGTRGAQMEQERRFYVVTAGGALAGTAGMPSPRRYAASGALPRFPRLGGVLPPIPASRESRIKDRPGGGGNTAPLLPEPRPHVEVLDSLYQHEPMLKALRKLTKRDFGFDQEAWRRWIAHAGAKELGFAPDGGDEDAEDSPKKRSVPEPQQKPSKEPAEPATMP